MTVNYSDEQCLEFAKLFLFFCRDYQKCLHLSKEFFKFEKNSQYKILGGLGGGIAALSDAILDLKKNSQPLIHFIVEPCDTCKSFIDLIKSSQQVNFSEQTEGLLRHHLQITKHNLLLEVRYDKK